MSDYPEAKLAFITNPERREAVLNVHLEGEEVKRFRLNRDQLFGLNSQTADILLKDFK
jgi:hypothetical protein